METPVVKKRQRLRGERTVSRKNNSGAFTTFGLELFDVRERLGLAEPLWKKALRSRGQIV
jgi:hypothetical protein